jgi:hypothetical protein
MSLTQQPGEEILISLIPLREGVDQRRFIEFAASLDLPTWRRKDVVLAFDTYQIADEDRSQLKADFVEVMRLRSMAEWEEVGRADPDIQPLAVVFADLVDEAKVQRIRAKPIS